MWIEKKTNIAIVGLGYVGLPLALLACRNNFKVFGIDISPQRISRLKDGYSDNGDIDDKELKDFIENGSLCLFSDFESIREVDVIVICVPTPLKNDEPDLTFLNQAVQEISKFIRRGTLVSLESTSFPGTTKEYVENKLSTHKEFGEDIYVCFSPERIDPNNKLWTVENTPKVVSSTSSKGLELARDFYGKLFSEIIIANSVEVAELAKLLENSFRLVNIVFINQFSELCTSLGFSAKEVIEIAATKPFGFTPFYPSAGVGGHCIPVDPAYLNWKARQVGKEIELIQESLHFNSESHIRILERIESTCSERNVTISRIGILGITYKDGVADTRESVSVQFMKLARRSGYEVLWHDPVIDIFESENSTNLDSVIMNSDILVVFGYSNTLSKSQILNCNFILDCTYNLDSSPNVTWL